MCSLFLIFLTVVVTHGQPPDTLWTKTYGGTDTDYGTFAVQTTDGGYIMTGSTYSFGAGEDDVWLIKTDAYGDTLWTRTYGGTGSEYGSCVAQTTDLGYIITGWTWSYGAGQEDIWLVKTDASGDTLWTRTYGGADFDYGTSVAQTTDGGYIITGSTYSFGAGVDDVWLLKTDASGDTQWARTYGGTDSDYGSCVVQTTDSGYVIAGETYSFGSGLMDVWLLKTDASGDTLWTKTYGGFHWDQGYSVAQTTDGGYIITGWTYSFGAGEADVYLIKTDASGDTLWTRTYGGSGDDYGFSVSQTTDGGYIITGYSDSFGAGMDDILVIKTDASGNALWTKTYGGASYDYGISVAQTTDGGYIISGQTHSFGAGAMDAWLIKTKPDVGIMEENSVIRKNNFSATIICGPLLLQEGRNCRVYDITGRTVRPETMRPGIYFIEIEGQIINKVVKVK